MVTVLFVESNFNRQIELRLKTNKCMMLANMFEYKSGSEVLIILFKKKKASCREPEYPEKPAGGSK